MSGPKNWCPRCGAPTRLVQIEERTLDGSPGRLGQVKGCRVCGWTVKVKEEAEKVTP